MSNAKKGESDLSELLSTSPAPLLGVASASCKALAFEASKNVINGTTGLDLLSFNRPGTLIWIDPRTGEERYTSPGDQMYSTALMYAESVIDKNGDRVDW